MANLNVEQLISRIADSIEQGMVPFIVMVPISSSMLRDPDIVDYAVRLAARGMREEIEDWRTDNANTN